jgi:hypothetical protein
MGINDKNRPLQRDVFESHAAQLRELHNAIQAAYARRIEGDVQWKAWQEACRRFHSSYDALAFPAGLGNAMSADFNDAESSFALRFGALSEQCFHWICKR